MCKINYTINIYSKTKKLLKYILIKNKKTKSIIRQNKQTEVKESKKKTQETYTDAETYILYLYIQMQRHTYLNTEKSQKNAKQETKIYT